MNVGVTFAIQIAAGTLVFGYPAIRLSRWVRRVRGEYLERRALSPVSAQRALRDAVLESFDPDKPVTEDSAAWAAPVTPAQAKANNPANGGSDFA